MAKLNTYLHRIRAASSDQCACGQARQTVEHFLFRCRQWTEHRAEMLQSAVCAVWLFANVWLANFMRAKVPSFNMAVVIYSILVTNSMTFGPMVATTAAAEAFIREQLLAMLFGLGLATGTSLLIFPVSSRMVAMREFQGLIGLLRKVVSNMQKEYLAGLAGESTFDVETGNAEERDGSRVRRKWKAKKAEKKARERGVTKEAKESKCLETVGAIRVLVGKLYGDMVFAKRDVTWGKLDATDLDETFKLIRNITIPMRVFSALHLDRNASDSLLVEWQ